MSTAHNGTSGDAVASPSRKTPSPLEGLHSPGSPLSAGPDHGYFSQRRSSYMGSRTHSRELVPTDGPIAEVRSNAISNLLQPPIVRTGLLPSNALASSHKPPTSKDIPPVTISNLRHVDVTSFDSYLRQAGSLYEVFQHTKDSYPDTFPSNDPNHSSSTAQRPSFSSVQRSYSGRKGSAPGTPIHEAFPSPSSPTPQALTDRRRGSRRRGPLAVAPLSTVPSVYFEPDFHLQNPRTFDVVSEKSEIVKSPEDGKQSRPGPPGGRKALATNAILQEKLSWYMDTVEVHLISSISTASSSFFAALGSLRELHKEAASSVTRIKALRADLSSVNTHMAQGGLKLVALRRRRDNVRKLDRSIKQVRSLAEGMGKCEEQVEKGDVATALEGLAVVESLYDGRPVSQHGMLLEHMESPLVNFRALKSLDGLASDIIYLRQKIGRTIEQRLLDALIGDLRKHIDSVPANDTFERWHNASSRARGQSKAASKPPAYLEIGDSLRASLKASLEGLAKANCLKQATAAYREALMREIKALIRKHLPASNDDDMESTMSASTTASTQGGRRTTRQEKSTILARNLRDLEIEDADEMLRSIYSNVSEALRRLGSQVKVVLDITSTFAAMPERTVTSPRRGNGGPTDFVSDQAASQDDIQQTLDMSTLLGQGVDIAQAQIIKVLKVRTEQSTHLPLTHFLRYFTLNRLFADECEAISGRGGVALKTVVNTHIKDFIQAAGQSERQKLLNAMDTDKWDAKDFGESAQQDLKDMVTASTQEVESWTRASVIWAASPKDEKRRSVANGQISKDKVRSATLDEQKYILPHSALLLLHGVHFFEQMMTGIPSMTQDITLSLLEYLKLFNSRSSQLILGAGATRSAGLKNITTKHLALASQALSFVTALISYIRECIRRHQTNPQGLMIELDKLKRLYQEHQSGINEKLVDIMSSRAIMHANSMRQIQWDAPSKSDGVSPYMETLIKETTTLHKVLSKHLPEMTVREIMDPVFKVYNEQWSKAFREAAATTKKGNERLLRDAEYFKSRISKVEGSGDLGDSVVAVIKARIDDAAKPAETDQPKDDAADKPPSDKPQSEKPESDTKDKKEQHDTENVKVDSEIKQ